MARSVRCVRCARTGYSETARNGIMMLPDSHKWQLLQSFQQSQAAAAGDIREQPEHWINVVNIEPSVENLMSLSVLLRQKPVVWVQEFISLSGTRHTADRSSKGLG